MKRKYSNYGDMTKDIYQDNGLYLTKLISIYLGKRLIQKWYKYTIKVFYSLKRKIKPFKKV